MQMRIFQRVPFKGLQDWFVYYGTVVLERVTNIKECTELVAAVLSIIVTGSQMVLNYLKDASTLLATLSAVQTENNNQHL